MSIVNEPKYKNGLLAAIRDQLEHRALWMYLLCDEAAKKDWHRKNTLLLRFADAGCTRAAICVRKPVAETA